MNNLSALLWKLYKNNNNWENEKQTLGVEYTHLLPVGAADQEIAFKLTFSSSGANSVTKRTKVMFQQKELFYDKRSRKYGTEEY